MPSIECQCLQCGHKFNKIVFMEDKTEIFACPECRSDKVKYTKNSPGLFKGISNFSSLAKDTN